ncbi:putative ABC transporter permease [Bifidobacterium sp. MA2]|uniref:ABC transporter permease n=1 Tax=Bifidobacterium santillanense TaxID=2809028 RepID=A0ABS5UPW0_9BIFI|nr:putative ABC transporter permease [Bifidobacterium santillanense]MBT1172922.1 putative ABC transporter permease [Bifidobacterium santillanense]
MPIIVEYLFLWFLFYSFCGWVYESILVSVQQRRPVNRGFLNGPLCPIYGTGAVMAVVLLGGISNPLVLFLVSAVGACVLEYFTSWAMERLFHARWWDYSHFRFNLNGRICLLGALVFGVGGVVIVDVVQPEVARVTAMIPLVAVHWLFVTLFAATVVDTIVTVVGIVHFEESLEQFRAIAAKYGDAMRERVGDVVDGATGLAGGVATGVAGVASAASDAFGGVPGRVGEKVGESLHSGLSSGREMSTELMMRLREAAGSVFSRQQRRMIASFPRLRASRNNESLEQLREAFEQLRRRG